MNTCWTNNQSWRQPLVPCSNQQSFCTHTGQTPRLQLLLKTCGQPCKLKKKTLTPIDSRYSITGRTSVSSTSIATALACLLSTSSCLISKSACRPTALVCSLSKSSCLTCRSACRRTALACSLSSSSCLTCRSACRRTALAYSLTNSSLLNFSWSCSVNEQACMMQRDLQAAVEQSTTSSKPFSMVAAACRSLCTIHAC